VVKHSDKVTTRLDYIITQLLAKRAPFTSGGAAVRLEKALVAPEFTNLIANHREEVSTKFATLLFLLG
jgi:hypothetical protein